MHDIIPVAHVGIGGFWHARTRSSLAAAWFRSAPAEDFMVGEHMNVALSGAQPPAFLHRSIDEEQSPRSWRIGHILGGRDVRFLFLPQIGEPFGLGGDDDGTSAVMAQAAQMVEQQLELSAEALLRREDSAKIRHIFGCILIEFEDPAQM